MFVQKIRTFNVDEIEYNITFYVDEKVVVHLVHWVFSTKTDHTRIWRKNKQQ